MSDKLAGFSRFLIVWFGQWVSTIGSGLTGFALGVYVFHLTGSAVHYSLILLASFLPSLLLKPIGGVMADRMNRRLQMIIGDAGTIIGVAMIIVMLMLGITALWPIYLGTIVSSIFVAVQNPAYKASVTDLLDEAHYSKGSGLMQLAESSKFILSPMIAGVLMSMFPITVVLLIDCATFLVAILTVFWVKKQTCEVTKTTASGSFFADFRQGLDYTLSHKSLMILLCIISVVTFFVGLLQALLGPMILVNHTAKDFGFALSIAATGMLISSLLISVFSRSGNKIRLLSISLFCSGVCFALIGISPHVVMITLFAFCFFLCLPFVNTSLDVLVRRNVDNQMQGRVWSMVSFISQLGMVVAFTSAGYIADHLFNPLLLKNGLLSHSVGAWIGVGPGRGIGLVFIISGLMTAAVGVVVACLHVLRRLDQPPHYCFRLSIIFHC